MKDITEELRKNEEAVKRLGGEVTGRLLQFEFQDDDGVWTNVEYYQDTLGMMPVQGLFNLVKKHVKSFVDGETGVKIGELFRGESELQQMTDSLKGASGEEQGQALEKTVEENKAIIDAVFKLMDIVPDLELEVYALSLGVPHRRVERFKDAISEPPYRGGLTIDEGFDLLRVFIRQNADAIKRFFTEEATSLVEEFQLVLSEEEGLEDQENGRSTGGKQSSTSAPAILANG